jgi:hypothetical protein
MRGKAATMVASVVVDMSSDGLVDFLFVDARAQVDTSRRQGVQDSSQHLGPVQMSSRGGLGFEFRTIQKAKVACGQDNSCGDVLRGHSSS